MIINTDQSVIDSRSDIIKTLNSEEIPTDAITISAHSVTVNVPIITSNENYIDVANTLAAIEFAFRFNSKQ